MWKKELNFDVNMPNPFLQHPSIHHFRSTTIKDVDMYLLTNWEKCIDEKVQLLAHFIETYGHTHTTSYNYYPKSTVHPTASVATSETQPCLLHIPGSPHGLDQPLQTQTTFSTIVVPEPR